MDHSQRQASQEFARGAVAVDEMARTLREIALGPAAQGWAVDGISCVASDGQGIFFECVAHRETIAARYIHLRDGSELVGRIHFCALRLDGSAGESLLAITLRADGEVSCPDGERWDLGPKNNPDYDRIRSHLWHQILAAVQRALPAA